MRRFGFVVGAVAIFALVGCSDDTEQVDTDGGTPDTITGGDGPTADTMVDSTVTFPEGSVPDGSTGPCNAATLGKACTAQNAQTVCGQGNTCLTSGQSGVCVCPCTKDDPSTPLVNEDSCPDLSKHICGGVQLTDGSTKNFCFQTCSPKLGANDCDGTMACSPSSGGVIGSIDKAICLFEGCKTNDECPVVTSTVCSVSKKNCATGETCVAIVSGNDEGRCAKPGTCDTKSGLCANKPAALSKATAKVGDPCKDDTDCGPNASCQIELDQSKYFKKPGDACTQNSDCCGGRCTAGKCGNGPCVVRNRNGYCSVSGCAFASTLTNKACGTGATCNKLFFGGICMKSCTLADAKSCRNNSADLIGDYECRAWNNLSIGGVSLCKGPVCDFGEGMRCDMLAASKLDCTSVAEKNNPTKMGCRGMDNKVKSSATDPTGFCFDNTASGTKTRTP